MHWCGAISRAIGLNPIGKIPSQYRDGLQWSDPVYILKTADGLYWTGVDFAISQRRAKRFDAASVVQIRASGVLAILFADGEALTNVRFVRLRPAATAATPDPAV
jgi:hypothetical protein